MATWRTTSKPTHTHTDSSLQMDTCRDDDENNDDDLQNAYGSNFQEFPICPICLKLIQKDAILLIKVTLIYLIS